MNADRYIRENSNYNQWAVHFKNRAELPEDEVKKICSEFATVKKVSQTGSSTGLCFINFGNVEDARKCVEGLNGHPDIQLRESKVNLVNNTNKNSAEKSSPRTNHFSDNNNNFNSDGNFINSKKQIEDVFFKDFISNPKSPNNDVDFNDDKKLNNSNDFGNNHDENITEKNHLLQNTKDYVVTSGKKIENDDKFKKLLDLKNNNVINTSTFNLLAEECEKELVSGVIEPEMPKLIPTRKIITQANGVPEKNLIPVIEAQEVIFANIPMNFGANYILHLVEKYQPLGASFVKVLKPHSLRYCFVYFPSPQLAEDVETKFDQFKLEDNKLIVLRTLPLKI